MPANPKLIEILRCPVSHQTLASLCDEKLDRLNSKISSGKLCFANGSAVEEHFEEGLITVSGDRVYRVDCDIPIMLAELSVPISDWD